MAVIVTSPVLDVVPLAMVRVTLELSVLVSVGSMDTVTVVAAVDCLSRLAVTVATPAFSDMLSESRARVRFAGTPASRRIDAPPLLVFVMGTTTWRSGATLRVTFTVALPPSAAVYVALSKFTFTAVHVVVGDRHRAGRGGPGGNFTVGSVPKANTYRLPVVVHVVRCRRECERLCALSVAPKDRWLAGTPE